MSHMAIAESAIFSMGCFWCGESEFKKSHSHENLPGIHSIRVGYSGGKISNPTYENHPGYKEAIKIDFDPTVIPYSELLDIFWENVDPFDGNGQFCDQGFAYTSAIFYNGTKQEKEAIASKEKIQEIFNQTVKTEIISATTFYDAEEYHQDYKKKNPVSYSYYRWNCGRDKRLNDIWSKYQ